MSTSRLLAIGREAQLAQLHDYWAQVRVGTTDEPAPSGQLRLVCSQPLDERPPPGPAPRPFVLSGLRIGGRAYEIVCWLPGSQPVGARWWEDLSAWFVVRRVARYRGVDRRQVQSPTRFRQRSTDLH